MRNAPFLLSRNQRGKLIRCRATLPLKDSRRTTGITDSHLGSNQLGKVTGRNVARNATREKLDSRSPVTLVNKLRTDHVARIADIALKARAVQ
jgi:hypothetical protein